MPTRKKGVAPKDNGRPRVDTDFDLFKRLAGVQCTIVEIAAVMGVSHDTIQRRMADNCEWQEAYAAGMHTGRASIRRQQFQALAEGNVTMMIWLGKQYLGQRDRQELEHVGKDGAPLLTDTQVRKLLEDGAPSDNGG